MIDPKTLEIVYDVDDVLWSYVGALSRAGGVTLEMWEDYYAPNNPWPEETISLVNQALADEEVYRDIEFFPGVADILRPEKELGVKVRINSNCITQKVANLKRVQLKAAIPDLHDDAMTFNFNTINVVCDKKLSPNTFIFVDDNPYHIIKSSAPINIVPKWPWNTSERACRMLAQANYTQLDDLTKINQFIFDRIKQYLEIGG